MWLGLMCSELDCWPEDLAKESDSDRCVKEADVQQLSSTKADLDARTALDCWLETKAVSKTEGGVHQNSLQGHVCMAKRQSSPCEGSNCCSNWLEGWGIAQLRDWKDKDPDISSVKSWLRQYEERPAWEVVASESAMSKAYWTQWHTLVIDNGVVYRLHKPHKHGDLSPVRQLVAPGKLRQDILHHLHPQSCRAFRYYQDH